MGYAPNQKGYIVMDLQDFSFHVSRDVRFNERVFPFNVTKSELYQLISNSQPLNHSMDDLLSHETEIYDNYKHNQEDRHLTDTNDDEGKRPTLELDVL